jgi:hypothetical protein
MQQELTAERSLKFASRGGKVYKDAAECRVQACDSPLSFHLCIQSFFVKCQL